MSATKLLNGQGAAVSIDDENVGSHSNASKGSLNAATNYSELELRRTGSVTDATPLSDSDSPETPSSPRLIIPFPRDKDFIQRKGVLDRLQLLSSKPGSRVALIGRSGVGKSQIAIEYAYRIREQSPETWVFWMHASNVTRYEQSIRSLAEEAQIPGCQDPESDIFQLVYSWLCSEKSGAWVVILDDISDASSQSERASMARETPISRPLPYSLNGSFLVTSRSKQAARRLVDDVAFIHVDSMSKIDALVLMEAKLGLEVRKHAEKAAQLALALEYIPLAIVQSASYIAQRAPLLSIARYLEMIQEKGEQRPPFTDPKDDKSTQDSESTDMNFLAWQISFEHIKETRPSAAGLLSLMSFGDRQGFPQELIFSLAENLGEKGPHGLKKLPEKLSAWDRGRRTQHELLEEDNTTESLDSDIQALRDYSLISDPDSAGSIQMHHRVQRAMQNWLKVAGQYESWEHEFLHRLSFTFPSMFSESWREGSMYLPHATLAVSRRPGNDTALEVWATVSYKIACYLKKLGRFQEAGQMAQISRTTRKQLLGPVHTDTLQASVVLTSVYTLQSQHGKAKMLEKETMGVLRGYYGIDHPMTVASTGRMALIYRYLGRLGKAEKLQLKVVKSCKMKLGADHQFTLASMATLADMYCGQGRWDKAEGLDAKIMKAQRPDHALYHPDTPLIMSCFPAASSKRGRLNEVEKLQREVLEARRRLFGTDHPHTIANLRHLASSCSSQGQFHEAEKLATESVAGSKRVLGLDNPETLKGMIDLATVYQGLGKLEKVEEVGRELAKACSVVSTDNLRYAAAGMDILLFLYHEQWRWNEAEDVEREMARINQAAGPK